MTKIFCMHQAQVFTVRFCYCHRHTNPDKKCLWAPCVLSYKKGQADRAERPLVARRPRYLSYRLRPLVSRFTLHLYKFKSYFLVFYSIFKANFCLIFIPKGSAILDYDVWCLFVSVFMYFFACLSMFSLKKSVFMSICHSRIILSFYISHLISFSYTCEVVKA